MLTDILKKVRILDLRTRNKITSVFTGNYRSAFKGRGIEFADIRPYDTGDDIRNIDWKTSSKEGELYVKTYHESRDNTLFFIIDLSPSMQFTSTGKKKYESVLETMALLAFSAVKNGDRIGALCYGNGVEKIFPPQKRRKNILNILYFCMENYVHPKFENTEKNEEKIFKTCHLLFKKSSSIFWMTDTLELSDESKKQIKMLRKKHDFTPIIFADPVEEKWKEVGLFPFQDMSSGKIKEIFITTEMLKKYQIIRMKKKLIFQKFFQRNHMGNLFITTSEKIFPAIFQFFQQRQKNY